eukprot:gnl/MRDRNA2_/MRDRNA2_93843_c0_seq1.p1 gnl/MRDRNA2_/MRDRNA2_93843_c0~~gnl/MRDRNA2_/MRDRNA2_93843_c0_seq1.p1  ORF type:complete len:229 (-),score=51.02 gnl/MRDRNA2_/MRDRNA2_93843_c0_seq1:25-711(-)
MSSSANEALRNLATDQYREDQKYCAKIGLRATEARIRSLEKRIESVHCKGKVKPEEKNEDEETIARQKEKEDSKAFLGARVQGYRNELCEGWGQHRVMLQPRPTVEELRIGRWRISYNVEKFRRPHHRVIVQRDEEEFNEMIKDCPDKKDKKSLRKMMLPLRTMRQNLFQRRINLAIHDRLINEWTLPKIKAELRRRGGRGEDQHKAPRLTVAEASPEVVAGAEEARA